MTAPDDLEKRDRLAGLLAAAEDDSLAELMRHGGPAQTALLVHFLPVDRSNHILQDLPNQDLARVMGCLAAQKDPATEKIGAEAIDGMIRSLEGASARNTPPLCVRALDLVGQIFGTWTDQPATTRSHR